MPAHARPHAEKKSPDSRPARILRCFCVHRISLNNIVATLRRRWSPHNSPNATKEQSQGYGTGHKKRTTRRNVADLEGGFGGAGKWSGQQDSNLRPSAPKADALPGCAIPRRLDFCGLSGIGPVSQAGKNREFGCQFGMPGQWSPGIVPESGSGKSRFVPYHSRLCALGWYAAGHDDQHPCTDRYRKQASPAVRASCTGLRRGRAFACRRDIPVAGKPGPCAMM